MLGAPVTRFFNELDEAIRRHGHVFVFLSLALSLVVDFGGVSFLAALLAYCLVFSRFGSIGDSVNQFDRTYRTSDAGKAYILLVLYLAISCFVTLYHQDPPRAVETSAKQMLIAYAICFHIKNYDVRTIFAGAAVGAILAGVAAAYDFHFLAISRAEGVTNPIRFGFLAGLFGTLSLIALLFMRQSRAFTILMALGALAGLLAAYLSGSVGTALSIPPMVLVILFKLWTRSKARTASVAAVIVLVVSVLFALDVGSLRTRAGIALTSLQTLSQGNVTAMDGSSRLRAKLLEISLELFRENPVLGVGADGWDAAVMASADADASIDPNLRDLNQAHNQFANDLAKGGLIQAASGLALLLVPLFLFLRRRPFSNDAGSLGALAGVVTCVGYAMIGLTESIMVLSLPACIYAILVFFLIAAPVPKDV